MKLFLLILFTITSSSAAATDPFNATNEAIINLNFTFNETTFTRENSSYILTSLSSSTTRAKTNQIKKLEQKILSKYMVLFGTDSTSFSMPSASSPGFDFDLLNKVLFIFGGLVVLAILLFASAYISFRKNHYSIKRGSYYYRTSNGVNRLMSTYSHNYNRNRYNLNDVNSLQVESIPLRKNNTTKVSF